MDKRVVVVGGGIAGLTAATTLAEEGVEVAVIEKRPLLGGLSATFTCKATDRCQQCGACMVEQTLKRAVSSPNIKFYLQSEVIGIEKNGSFTITLKRSPFTGEETVATYSRYNRESFLKEKQGSEDKIKAQAVILATGFTPFDPRKRPTYGYGQWKNVITGVEMEQMLRARYGVFCPSNGKKAKKIAFIQCVGSRNAQFNTLWCSEVCCPYALRMGSLIKHMDPEAEVWVFFIDLQNVGKEGKDFFNTLGERLRLVNIVPVDIFGEKDGKVTIAFEEDNSRKRETFDLVVLSVGISPNKDNRALAEVFGIEMEENGFFKEDGERGTCKSTTSGIFLAGTSTGPKGILETISHARGAAFETLTYLGGV